MRNNYYLSLKIANVGGELVNKRGEWGSGGKRGSVKEGVKVIKKRAWLREVHDPEHEFQHCRGLLGVERRQVEDRD